MPRESAARAMQVGAPVVRKRIFSSAETSVHRSVGVIELTADGQVVYADRTVHALAGLNDKISFHSLALIGLNHKDVVNVSPAQKESSEYEIELTRQNGKRIPIAIRVFDRSIAPGRGGNVILTIRSLVEERITTALRERTRSSKTAHRSEERRVG